MRVGVYGECGRVGGGLNCEQLNRWSHCEGVDKGSSYVTCSMTKKISLSKQETALPL